MKKINLILALNLIILNSAFSADSKPTVYDQVTVDKNIKNGDGTDTTLQKLLTIKGVDVVYEACKTKGKKLEEMSGCIWNDLSDDLKKQVQQAYADEAPKDNSRTPASATSSGSNLTMKSKQIKTDYMSDPAVVELSKVFQKKLEEALLGDEAAQKDKKKIAIVDHAKFIELYKTELGKTVVSAFTSYCMEAVINKKQETTETNCKDDKNNPTTCPLYFLAKDKKTNIKTNIDSLKKAHLESSTAENPNADSQQWSNCIASVNHVCYTDLGTKYDNINEIDVKESKTRACTIMDYVKSARKNLILADQQDAFYKDLGRGNSFVVENAQEVKITDKNSMDAVTTITSKDVENSYEVKNKELEKELSSCIDDNNQILDSEKCKKFISADRQDKEKAVTEFGLRQFALGDKMEDKLKNKSDVEKYLVEEGYKPEKIKEMLKDDNDLTTVKEEIKKRYESERNAIIASMAQKVEKKTTTKDGFNATDDKSQMVKIKEEISSRAEELKQLVHFNNIVSSYLEIDKGGTKSRNVASLNAELSNGSEKIKGGGADQIKEIQKNAKDSGLMKKTDPASDEATNLSVDNLNNIFKYSNEK